MSKTNPASDQLLLGDDYIADLLVQDAADYALRYSAHGLDALKPEKPSSLQPKPNTRFLRNIIKATDSHNAALLAKEAAESRVRLNKLDNPVDERKHRSHSSKEASRRQFGAINAILGGQHKGRLGKDGASSKSSRSESRKADTKSDIPKSTSQHPRARSRDQRRDDCDSKNTTESRKRRHHRSPSRERERQHDDKHREHHSSHRPSKYSRSHKHERDSGATSHSSRQRSPSQSRSWSRSRSRSPRQSRSPTRSKRSRRHRSSSAHSRSPHRSRSPRRSKRSRRHQSPTPRSSRSHNDRHRPREPAKYSSDQDDGDDYGPQPQSASTKAQPRPRGRGTISTASGIDGRFAADYDPRTDTTEGSDKPINIGTKADTAGATGQDVWTQAINLYRECQKTRTSQDSHETDLANVRWKKRGEQREWDLGKSEGEEGLGGDA
ncbi:hypothetical protein BROUX41_002356 [Berkeleyomyces rouxiae]